MVSLSQQKILDQELIWTGLKEWHDAGIKGKSLHNKKPRRILIAESIGNAQNHWARHENRVKWAAPNAEYIIAGIEQSGGIHTITHNGKRVELEELIASENIKVISRSIGGPASDREDEETAYYRELIKKYRIALYNSAGNEYYGDGETIDAAFPARVAKYTTACYKRNEVITIKDYSSAGKQVDYCNVVGWDSGTSFASPVTASEALLIAMRYDEDMCDTEINNFLDSIAKDVWREGTDEWSGVGIPIMPNLSRRYITFRIGDSAVNVDGNKAKDMDVPAVIVCNRTFVPIRAIAELLGWDVSYITNPDKSIQVKIQKGEKITVINTGSRALFVNGITLEMDAPAFILNGRTMIPFRFIASILSGQVNWVPEDKKVTLLEA
jgi:hypothetical protein